MRGLRKSTRVSWAPELNLCQVKLFLSDESPSQIGLISGEDHLQAKTLWHQQSIGTGSDENLPPGFEGPHLTSSLKNKLSLIPVIKWRCPPKFMLDLNWLMVSGEESHEVEAQNQREMRVLEAIYPRPSAIPADPSPLLNMDDFPINDKITPLIPITPIEDEEAMSDPPLINDSSNRLNPINIGVASTSGIIHGVEPDVAAAAYNALTSILPSGDQGGLIDHELLLKILNDPKTIENLLADHRAATNSQNSQSPRIHLSDPNPPFYLNPSNRLGPLPNVRPPPPPPESHIGNVRPPPESHIGNVRPPPPPPESHIGNVRPPPPPESKDMNYFKSLIQQHGGERTDNAPSQFGNRQSQSHQVGGNPEFSNHNKPRDSKHRTMKPCMFFNSSRGCRRGANCTYQHDPSPQPQRPEVQATKRMKFDREITG